MTPCDARRAGALLLLAAMLAGCRDASPGRGDGSPAGPHSGDGPGGAGSAGAIGTAAGALPLDPPAGPGSLAPRLSRIPEGGLALSWLEPLPSGTALRWSQLPPDGAGWTPSRTIVESPLLLLNAADVPGVAALGEGRFAAHWRQTREPAGAGYDALVSLSFDHGRTWEEPVLPHRDRTDTEHGFVAIYEASPPMMSQERTRPGGTSGDTGTSFDLTGTPVVSRRDRDVSEIDAGIAWLDGREAAASPEAFSAQLLTTSLESGGAIGLGLERVLDSRTCECCPIAAARAGDATLIAYRDRSDAEIRDVAILRRASSGEWDEPVIVHADGWQVRGCPVNGPAIDAEGARAVVAWFTAAQGEPRVQAAFSADGGRSWSGPVRVDSPGDGQAAGHAGVALLADDSAIVSCVLRQGAELVVATRRVVEGAEPEPAEIVGHGVVGIPSLARSGDDVLLAWIERVAATPEAAESRRLRALRWKAPRRD